MLAASASDADTHAPPVGISLNNPTSTSIAIADAIASPLQTLLRQARQLAAQAGLPAYLVGGPVRDILLGFPVKDLDIAVVQTPGAGDATTLAARLAHQTGGRLTVHPRFGTATVTIAPKKSADATIDLVTARRETYSAPGALPDVQPGSLADDLARRDFTINAMAIPLHHAGRGATQPPQPQLDPHGGLADLQAGRIRILHPQSFRDDPTRAFRAARYAARLNFAITDDTIRALQKALPNAMSAISGDRARHELDRIFRENQPLPALQLADNLGILTSLHPSLTTRHLDAITPPPPADSVAPPPPLAWLSALVRPLSPNQAAAFRARINAPAHWTRVINDTVTLSARLDQLAAPQIAPSTVCALLDGLAPEALDAALRLAPNPTAVKRRNPQIRINRYRNEWQTIAPILRGHDLLELGIPPGPAVGAALRRLRQARLDGQTQTRADEETLVRQTLLRRDDPSTTIPR